MDNFSGTFDKWVGELNAYLEASGLPLRSKDFGTEALAKGYVEKLTPRSFVEGVLGSNSDPKMNQGSHPSNIAPPTKKVGWGTSAKVALTVSALVIIISMLLMSSRLPALADSTPKALPSDDQIEIDATYEVQWPNFLVTGRITNTGLSIAPGVQVNAQMEQFWPSRTEGRDYTPEPGPGGTYDYKAGTLINLRPGESRTISYVISRRVNVNLIDGLLPELKARGYALYDGEVVTGSYLTANKMALKPHIVADGASPPE